MFLFATVSKPFLGRTQPPVQWVPSAFFLGVKPETGLRMLQELFLHLSIRHHGVLLN
jgi:hypothetical protein